VSPSCGALSSVRANGPVSMSVSYQRIDCRGICPRRRVAMLPPETVCICIPMAKRMRTLILFDWNVDTPPDHVARRATLGDYFTSHASCARLGSMKGRILSRAKSQLRAAPENASELHASRASMADPSRPFRAPAPNLLAISRKLKTSRRSPGR
jgi:hypothetical protein